MARVAAVVFAERLRAPTARGRLIPSRHYERKEKEKEQKSEEYFLNHVARLLRAQFQAVPMVVGDGESVVVVNKVLGDVWESAQVADTFG